MTSPAMTNPPRTKAEAILSIKYQIRLHALHRRLFKRVQSLLAVVSLLAGAAALIPFWQSIPGGITISAVIVAFVSIVGALGGFAEDSVKHDIWRREAADLLARSAGMDLVAIDAALAYVPGDDETIESLRAVAFNDVLTSGGFDDGKHTESCSERVFRQIA
jgi:hypothetical protein